MIDRLSKLIYFIPCNYTVSAANLASLFIDNIAVHYGISVSIVSNRDLWFTSYFWYSFISALGCKHSMSMALHPETDGLSEKVHRSIE